MTTPYKPPLISGLTGDEQELFSELWEVYYQKLTRNKLKMFYYDGKNRLKDLGISIPPPLKGIETVVGWPAKAVDQLASRSRFDGFTYAESTDKTLDLLVKQNRLKSIYRQAVSSELQCSCAALTVSNGEAGEPDVVVSAYSAKYSAMLWDYRKKRIKCGFAIVDINKNGNPSWINFYTDSDTIQLVQSGNNRFIATRYPHEQGRPLMEPLIFKPSLDRPFGKSRVSRAVMSLTDSAVREALRTEISSEFFTAPQRYLLGGDEDTFKTKDGKDKPKWESYIASVFSVTPNENGEIPRYGQLPQMSMLPHTDYFKSLAARFAGETNVPISSLGVIHDNPSSAQAMYAAKEDLIIEATDLNETNGDALETIGKLMIAMSQNKTLDDLDENEMSITANFMNPATPSIVSQADAIVKILSPMPEYAYSDVILEELGFSEDKIMRLQSDRRKARATDSLLGTKKESSVTMYKVTSVLNQLTRGQITESVAIKLLEMEGMSESEAKEYLNLNSGAKDDQVSIYE